MTASRPPRRAHVRTSARTAGALAAVCCLAALSAVPAAAAAGDDGQGSSGSADSAAVAVGGELLAEPGVQVQPLDGAPDLPSDLSALSWTVSDATTGQVLAAKNAHRELPPASTLKTLFADTVLPRFSADTTHTVTDADLADVGEGSSLVGVQAGQTYTVADLWRGVFLASGNDAVHVLAHMNGSVPLTVSQMQAKARMLGADDTHVVSPDGYDEPGQVSSAYDLAVFARVGLADPDFAQYASTKEAQFPGGVDDEGAVVPSFGIQNTNRLLTGAKGVTPYPGIIGVKNGYTTNAGNTLVAAARRDGRTLIVTVMNPQSGVYNAVYNEATELLDWGFAAAGHTSSVGTLNAVPAALEGTPAGVPALAPSVAPAPAPARQPAHQPERRPTGAPLPAQGTPTRTPENTVSTRSAVASPTAWSIGGALVLIAGACVLLLRRRSAAKSQ